MLSFTEENYLKALLKLLLDNEKEGVGTNELASHLNVKPATANDMLKKLKEKSLVEYEKYGKIFLTTLGNRSGIEVLRKHRLWETFLVKHLNFTWDEVHEVAEQLEHIQSDKLLDELATFLGNPEFDPHGDPIPDKHGKMPVVKSRNLSNATIGKKLKVVKVGDNTASFLKYLDKQGIALGDTLMIKEIQDFDGSVLVELKGKKEVYLSAGAAEKIMVI